MKRILIFFIVFLLLAKVFSRISDSKFWIISSLIVLFLISSWIIYLLFKIRKKLINSKKKIYFLILVLIIVLGIFLKLAKVTEPLAGTEVEWNYKQLSKEILMGQKVSYFTDHTNLNNLLLTGFFLLFGIKSSVVTILGLLTYILTCIVIYLLVDDMFRNKLEALVAVLIFSILPQTLIYYTSAEAEPFAALLITLTVFFIWKSLKDEKFLTLLALSLALSINMKIEMLIFIIPSFLLIYAFKKLKKKHLDSLVLFLYASIPGLLYVFKNRGFNNILNRLFPKLISFKTNEAPLDYSIKDNARLFFENLFDFSKHALVFFPLMALAFIDWKREKKQLIILSSFLITYTAVFSTLIYAYQFRYIILIYPLLCILISHGISKFSLLTKRFFNLNKYLSLIIVLIIIFASVNSFQELKSPRLENKQHGLQDLKPYLSNDTIVVCNPDDVCGFELLEAKIRKDFTTNNQRFICIDSLSDDFCENKIELRNFSLNKIILFNKYYKAVLLEK